MNQRALLLDIFLQSSLYNRRQPEDEQHLSFDIVGFSQTEFTLAPNTEAGDNPGSVKDLGAVAQFIYFYAPFTLEMHLGSLVIPTFKKIFILSGAISSVVVKNLSTERSVTCNVIHT